MAEPISARRMAAMVCDEIDNPDFAHWTPTKTLSVIDQAIQHLYLIEQDARQSHEMDVLDVDVATARAAGTLTPQGSEPLNLSEWLVPDYVYRIRLIENTSRGTVSPEIPFTDMSDREEVKRQMRSASWTWTRRGETRQKIGFIGQLAGVSSFRVWYARRLPPLHYGTAKSGLNDAVPPVEAASTAARIWFDIGTDGAGRIIERGEVYVGSLIEFGSHPTNGNVLGVTDEVRCIDAGAMTLLTTPLQYAWLWQFDQILQHPGTLTTLNCVGHEYSLIPQIGQEHHELVILMAATRLAKATGSVKNIQLLKGEAGDLYTKFIDAVQLRQAQTVEKVQVRHGEW